MIAATSIEFINDLAQYHYNNHYYDFHNDYTCGQIVYTGKTLALQLNNNTDNSLISLKFTDVIITAINFFNVEETTQLTIDSLYRGRLELNGELIETSEDGNGYFYLEFYEGQKLEFWARSVGIGNT
ncbi:hypothetical protein [Filimonas effusa]|uniref:Uncharacterized protein n=1 Tax=Filimonas effusa TaxID=2508721 RepID=A0A4Q1D8F3_9BACT|nr:hypothetical protein [Filimonas effusa]RXK85614.1 hypothetical protein ESB13_02025 [Filimonas effusa]